MKSVLARTVGFWNSVLTMYCIIGNCDRPGNFENYMAFLQLI
jgi:hypothetical protein